MTDLRFAWDMVRHVKSNAIVLCRDHMLLGTGQMSRVDSVEIAIKKAGPRAAGSVLASDAFFPFPRLNRDRGRRPRGRRHPARRLENNAETIAACDHHGIPMIFTGQQASEHHRTLEPSPIARRLYRAAGWRYDGMWGRQGLAARVRGARHGDSNDGQSGGFEQDREPKGPFVSCRRTAGPGNSAAVVETPDALVDTGATLLSLPKRIVAELGLVQRPAPRTARTAAGILSSESMNPCGSRFRARLHRRGGGGSRRMPRIDRANPLGNVPTRRRSHPPGNSSAIPTILANR